MPTIKDVAEACGVSRATVSQVLSNGRRPVHAETRERVLQTARALNYQPSAVARGLVRKRMNTVGLAFVHGDIPAHTNPFMMMVLDGILSVCTRQRRSTMLCTISRWEGSEHLPELSDGRCDGVLLLVPPSECVLFDRLRQRKVPFVLVNARDSAGRSPSVDVDNVQAAYEATQYLVALGHRRIAFVLKQYDWIYPFAHERQAGYRRALTDRGLYDPSLDALSWEAAAATDFSTPQAPTALFSAYDAEALPLMKHLQQRGVRIPEDVSLVSFDDIPEAAASEPALTTVRQPMTRIGERAAELLLARIDGTAAAAADALPPQEILPTELIVRASAAAPPRCPY